ncbi:MAG: peptidylprolyl isomerase, partial [Alistipes sp.]|nr:peptidylprolyl isomerase [Alistipes sp.]
MVLAVLAFSFISEEAFSQQQRRQVMLDKVVAVVGGSSILHSEVSELADALVEQRRKMGYTSDRDPMNEALEKLLEQKLLYNQALIDSVETNTAG